MRKFASSGIGVALVASVLIVWQVLARNERIAFFIASPYSVVREIIVLLFRGELLPDLATTAYEAGLGLFLGMAIGTSLGLCLWLTPFVAGSARPMVKVIGAIPILAIAPLMIIWFGIGIKMKVAMATITTVFIAFGQAYRGAEMVSEDQLEIVSGLGGSRWTVLGKIVVPSALHWVLNSMRVNAGLALIGALVGELAASDVGLGYRLQREASLYNVPRAFAVACGIVVTALIFDLIATFLEKKRNIIAKWISVPRVLW